MQWTVVFLLGSVLSVMARPWIGPNHDFGVVSNGPRTHLNKQHDDIMWNPNYQKDLFEILNYLAGKRDTSQLKTARKRALTTLTMWKPIGSAHGKVRVQSKAPLITVHPDIRFRSSESGEAPRIMGHPLRWGKKR